MRMFVTITPPAFDRLRDLARLEQRTTRAQASVLLERLLQVEEVPGGQSEAERVRPC